MPEIFNFDLMVFQNADGTARIEKYLVDDIGAHLVDVIVIAPDDYAFLELIAPENEDA